MKKTRKIIGYLAPTARRRPHIRQYTASNERGAVLQNEGNYKIILTKYEAMHQTAVSENNSSSGMLQ